LSVVTSAAPYTDSVFTLSPEKAEECDLKLLISDAQILAALFHLPSKTFIHVLHPAFANKAGEKKITAQFIDFVNNNPVLNLMYNSVTAAFLSQSVTLVPNAIYIESSKNDYIKLVEPPAVEKSIVADNRDGNDFTVVFSEDKNLIDTVKEKFPGCKLSHSASFLINHLQKDYAAGTTQRVFAYVLPDKLQLIVTGKDKPLFYNIFSYTTSEDFIYYILLVYKKTGFDPEKTPLIFLGEILSQSKLFELTVKYIRNVGFGKRPAGSVNYSEELKQLPSHFYYGIFSMV
jgi:hypothetical protein